MKTNAILACLLLSATCACGAQPHRTHNKAEDMQVATYIPSDLHSQEDPNELHLSIHSDRIWSRPHVASSGIHLSAVQRAELKISTAPPSEPGLLERVTGIHVDVVGGPPPLGCCRPNGWSGLQTTIPNGVPGQTVGITFKHF